MDNIRCISRRWISWFCQSWHKQVWDNNWDRTAKGAGQRKWHRVQQDHRRQHDKYVFLDLKKETNTVCNWFVIRPLRQRQVRGDLLLRVWGSLEICRRLAKLFQGLWQVFAFSFLQNTDKKCLQSAGFVKEEMTNKRCFPQGQVRNDKPIRVARSPHHFRLQP